MAKAAALSIAAFDAVSNSALKLPKLPGRLKILDWGVSNTCDGQKVTLDDQSIKVFEAFQKRTGRTRVALDYNHSTVPNAEAHKQFGGQPNIFAYGDPKIVKGDGLYLENMQWTPWGEANAKSCSDISPAPVLKEGRVVGLHSAALTPTGAIEGLTFYSAFDTEEALLAAYASERPSDENKDDDDDDDDDDPAKMSSDIAKEGFQFTAHDPANAECKCMTCTEATKIATKSYAAKFEEPPAFRATNQYDSLKTVMNEHLKYFASQLGLPETATMDEVMPALRAKWVGLMKDKQPINKKSDVDTKTAQGQAGSDTPTGTITYEAVIAKVDELLTSKLTPFTAKITALENHTAAELAAAQETERARLVADASRDGKVIPLSAEALKVLPVAVLKEIVGKLPKGQVSVKPLVRTFTTTGGSAGGKRTREDASNAWGAEAERLCGQAGMSFRG